MTGIHADNDVVINNGDINITKSYEGIEGLTITINDGNIQIIASDDGLNVAGGNDSSSINGRMGQNNFSTGNSNTNITINGGYICINAVGDGIDSNGSVYINNGTIIVNGPIDNGNGALDYDGELVMTGGTLIAAGSSGMLQTISNSSSVYCITVTFSTTKSANTIIDIRDSSNNDIITFAPAKQYQSVVIATHDIQNGETYTIYSGGEYSGTEKNGLYSEGTYAVGTQEETVTTTNIVTTVGSAQNMMNQQGGFQMNPKQNGGKTF